MIGFHQSTSHWFGLVAALALTSCDRTPPPDTEATSAALSAAEAEVRRYEDFARVNNCCIALQNRSVVRGEPFITASKKCVARTPMWKQSDAAPKTFSARWGRS